MLAGFPRCLHFSCGWILEGFALVFDGMAHSRTPLVAAKLWLSTFYKGTCKERRWGKVQVDFVPWECSHPRDDLVFGPEKCGVTVCLTNIPV